MLLSVVIPAYNEEKRLKSTLEQLSSYFGGKDYGYEVTVVDDGSSDGTTRVAKESELFRNGRLRVVSNGTNRGKGYAVRNGILVSKGDFILLSDADLSTPISELEKFLPIARSGCPIIIGSRSIEGAHIAVRQPFYREFMGKVFNRLVRIFLLNGFADTQCGFKLFRRDAANDIAQRLKIEGFAFDVEALYLASKRGYKVREVPVTWLNSSASSLDPITDSCRMLADIFRIKWMHR